MHVGVMVTEKAFTCLKQWTPALEFTVSSHSVGTLAINKEVTRIVEGKDNKGWKTECANERMSLERKNNSKEDNN